ALASAAARGSPPAARQGGSPPATKQGHLRAPCGETFLQLFEAACPLPADADTSRWRARPMSSSRSSSVSPPHTPYGSRTASAWAAHSARTGHLMQTSLAEFSRAL